jgi:hypothetical protein
LALICDRKWGLLADDRELGGGVSVGGEGVRGDDHAG